MIATLELERHMTGINIFSVVICNPSHEQEPYIVIQFLIDKTTQICLYLTILSLDLVFRL